MDGQCDFGVYVGVAEWALSGIAEHTAAFGALSCLLDPVWGPEVNGGRDTELQTADLAQPPFSATRALTSFRRRIAGRGWSA